MDWASANEIDTAKLKAAKVPVYGKWYFPDIPAGVPLVNLQSGEIETFGPGLRAGETLYVPEADLRRARLGPHAESAEAAGATAEEEEPAAQAAEQSTAAETAEVVPTPSAEAGSKTTYDQPLAASEQIHLPGPSIFPLVLALGLAIALVGVVAGPLEVRLLVVGLGLLYVAAGGVGWALQNYREGQGEGHAGEGSAAEEAEGGG
jgi:hypothetical protein